MQQTKDPAGKFYFELMPANKGEVLKSIIRRMGVEDVLKPSSAFDAWDIHKDKKIPLRLAIEAQIAPFSKDPFSIETLSAAARNLNSHFQVTTSAGTASVSVSLLGRTTTNLKCPSYKVNGLHHFTAMSFRIMPGSSEIKRFDPQLLYWLRNPDPNKYIMIIELGFAKIGEKPVIAVTNVQANKIFYKLPPNLKRIFKEAHTPILKAVKKASGNIPLLVPTNKTVQEMIQSIFGHSVSDKVLNEFYDGFSRKRDGRKAKLRIRNELDNKKFTAEFWFQIRL